MNPDSATTSSSAASQSAAFGPQPAPAAPLDLRQLFWDVATLAFELLTRLVGVLRPVQARFPKQSWQVARLLIDLPRIFLTIRYVPERVTTAQLRHLTRARHILQALFNYTLPTQLGPRTSPSASATSNQSPSASTQNATPPGARKPSSATPTICQVPAVREVPAIPAVTATPASSEVPASSPSPTLDRGHLPSDHPSHPSHSPHSAFRTPHSTFSPYIPDFHTLAQALKSDTLPPNCAGALFENPGDALVRALHQLHAVYFSLYPQKSPSPSQSPSPSSGNLQSSICNPQSPSVHPVHPVHSVHSPSPAQSEISNLKSEIPSPHSEFRIPHSDAPP